MVMLQVRKRRKKPQPRGIRPPSTFGKFLGWCVHGYTALGLVAAGVIAVLIVRGDADAFRWCFLLMAAATIVDSTDGTLARKVCIKEVVPGFDGRRLDDIVDFLNYTFLPVLLIWRAQILPTGYEAWLFLPLLASVYGFCQVQAKTDDGYFLGFPSLWNLVALYLYVLHLYESPQGDWVALALVIVLALLTFVPIRHLYPSQPGLLNRVSMIAGRDLDSAGRLVDLEAARRRRAAAERVDHANRAFFATLSDLLPGRFVGDQRDPLAEAYVLSPAACVTRSAGTSRPLSPFAPRKDSCHEHTLSPARHGCRLAPRKDSCHEHTLSRSERQLSLKVKQRVGRKDLAEANGTPHH